MANVPSPSLSGLVRGTQKNVKGKIEKKWRLGEAEAWEEEMIEANEAGRKKTVREGRKQKQAGRKKEVRTGRWRNVTSR